MRYGAVEIAKSTSEAQRAAMLAYNALCDAHGASVRLALTGEDEEPCAALADASEVGYEIDQALTEAKLAMNLVLVGLYARSPEEDQPEWAKERFS